MSSPSHTRPRLHNAETMESVPQKVSSPIRLFTEPEPFFTPVSSHEEVDDVENNVDDASDKQGRLRRAREEEESLELARLLMAEEAMASYHHHFQLLRESAGELAQEDYEALQAALEEEANAEVAGLEDEHGQLSYDAMLELGERIGDVKSERWALVAAKEVDKLPTFIFDPNSTDDRADNQTEAQCLVCQCEFKVDEELRRLPCGHSFHLVCVDQWLKDKDSCPYCRTCIVERE